MNELERIITDLKEVDILDCLKRYLDGDEILEKEKSIYDLFDFVRDALKKDNDIQKLLENYLNKESTKLVLKIVNRSLVHYNNFTPLRTLERENIFLAKDLIKLVFEEYLVRYNVSLVDKYEIYALKNPKELIDLLKSFEMLTDYYVSLSYTKMSFFDDLREETEISDELAKTCAEYYETFYSELRMGYIIKMLKTRNGKN